MRTRHVPLAPGRALHHLRRRLWSVLDAGQRRDLADMRFYQLMSEGDPEGGDRGPHFKAMFAVAHGEARSRD